MKTGASTNTADFPPLTETLRETIEAIYHDLDREVESLGVVCWARGDCCDFPRSSHRLYASSVEISYTLAKHPVPPQSDSQLCPFWVKGRCTERERRPLGCRTYFCDRSFSERLEAMYEKHYRRLRRAAAAAEYPWRYVPFVVALSERRQLAGLLANADQPEADDPARTETETRTRPHQETHTRTGSGARLAEATGDGVDTGGPVA